ncbi:MAG: hypothetical protein NTY20_05615 [Candidatus Aenigmarchaeota archaeon]|nr:hypothetical protein [Candidatus Aenigmarchaeota archaeon]
MALDILAIATILLAPVFAEFAKIRTKATRAFSMIAASGVLFLLAMGFSVFAAMESTTALAFYGAMLFDVVGFIFLLVGAVWAAITLMQK